MYRELDRSSQYLIHNIIRDETITDLHDLLWKIIVYKFYNVQETFTHSKYGLKISKYKSFDKQALWDATVEYRENVGDPFHDAYMKNPTNVTKKKIGWIDSEHRGIFRDFVYTNVVLVAAHKIIPELVKLYKQNAEPRKMIDLFITLPATATFMAVEFFLDISYIKNYRNDFQEFKYTGDDLWNAGPGAITGIRLIFPSLPKSRKDEAISMLKGLAEDELVKYGKFKSVMWDKKKEKYILCPYNINHHNIEMWCCEYQKYWKMKVGAGKQRKKFIPKTIII